MASAFGLRGLRRVQSVIIGGWLVFTVSLAIWWLVHGLVQTEKFALLSPEVSSRLIREQHMLYGEGLTLILFLLAGGMALWYYNRREQARNKQVQEFFATLTHELKTPLASLRVQVESLQEDLSGTDHSKLIDRLASDAARLELQLENALFLASFSDAEQLHLERVDVGAVARAMGSQWRELEVNFSKPCYIIADVRALEGVLKNLIQNARVHGHATVVSIEANEVGRDVILSIKDNGQGFRGDPKKLGQLFVRHTTVSGSGVGIYLARKLIEKMNGKLEFVPQSGRGFTVLVTLSRLEELA